MEDVDLEDTITVGNYVIVKRLNYKKIYRVTDSGVLTLGHNTLAMKGIIGHPFWTTFEYAGTTPVGGNRNKKKNPTLTLTVANKVDFLEDLKDTVPSGVDNRSVIDDGNSQKLSKEDILSLCENGKTGREIVSSLIENNVSFSEKTEYSQEKYIRKKEKKYCTFISVHKPTLSCIHEIFFRNDPSKINYLRTDTLAQILSYSDVKADGTYILFDSGSNGLGAAAVMSRIGADTPGNLVYLHPGRTLPTLTALRAMNFTQEHMDRMPISSIYDFIKFYYNGDTSATVIEPVPQVETNSSADNMECEDTAAENSLKRKQPDNADDLPPQKKSKRVLEVERACDILKSQKADGLIIIAKEHPLNILQSLLPFVGLSRPFVIYHMFREPLQETFIALRQNNKAVNLKLFSNFLRSYQVLPDRTHPDILTNDLGGYLLTGYLVN